MKRWILIIALPLIASVSRVTAQSIGWNLSHNEDYGTSVHFVDVFKNAREWLTANVTPGGPFDTGHREAIPVDEHGWPARVPFDVDGEPQLVHTLVELQIAGRHTLIFEGSGRIRLHGVAGWEEFEAAGGETRRAVAIPSSGQLLITILRSDAADPIRDIRFILPGFEETYEEQPFHPSFIEELSAFHGPLRTMDWGRTNAHPIGDWQERRQAAHYTQTGELGVAYEYHVALANEIGRDLWICVPHLADDAFVESLAEFLLERLDPTLQVWLEYSNETWNADEWAFPQNPVVNDRGFELGFFPEEEEFYPEQAIRNNAGHRYHSYRTAQLWGIFEDVWGSEAFQTRVRRVIPGQSFNNQVNEIRLQALHRNERYRRASTYEDPRTGELRYSRFGEEVEINPRGYRAEYLAVAPYVMVEFNDEHAQRAEPLSVEEVLQDARESVGLEETSRRGIRSIPSALAANSATAEAEDVELVAYEAGQSLRVVGRAIQLQSGTPSENANRVRLVETLQEANRSEGMYEIYLLYLTLLCEHGFDHINHFNFVDRYTQWGSWGAKEFYNDNDAPKYRALWEWNAGFHRCDMPPPSTEPPSRPPGAPGAQPGGDHDRDGVPNELDTDMDGDGVANLLECTHVDECEDLDGDGVPNHLDVDSDGDGHFDLVEANDTDRDGVANREPSGVDTDGDGLDDRFDPDCSAGCGVVIGETPLLPDTDLDGSPDLLDPDDDGDGIFTMQEVTDALNYRGANPNPIDLDSDGMPNYLDSDSDGDGLLDEQEDTRPDASGDADQNGTLDYLEAEENEEEEPRSEAELPPGCSALRSLPSGEGTTFLLIGAALWRRRKGRRRAPGITSDA